jgi:enterochelin esterase-like enzyme
MSEVSRRTFLASSAAVGLLEIPGLATAQERHPTAHGGSELEFVSKMVAAARLQPSGLVELLQQNFPNLSPQEVVSLVWGQSFLFVLKSDKPVTITIDDLPATPMIRLLDSNYFYYYAMLRLGTTHNYTINFDEQNSEMLSSTSHPVWYGSVAGYNPNSYPASGIPRGTLSEMHTIISAIYGGAKVPYWLYVNPGIDEVRGAPLMIWLDGSLFVGSSDVLNCRMQTVTDNLVDQKLIPPMVHLLLQPGDGGVPLSKQFPDQTQALAVRSLQFDTVTEQFNNHLETEVLPEVQKAVKLRSDGYSRGISGQSSGGACAFKVAWFRPEQFSRVYSNIGSFTNLQWHPESHQEGAAVFPFWVRREPRKDLRVWLSDGCNDIDILSTERRDLYEAGSWPLANLELAQALKTRFYDFHFRFGTAYHNAAQWALDLPDMLPWLWRGYDPEKLTANYEQEASERAQPVYRVQINNRDAW